MTRTKNIEALKEVIRNLGLPSSLERQLELYCALQTDHFKLPFRLVKQEDILNMQLHFEKQGEAVYTCTYFDLCLRKKMGFKDKIIEGIDLAVLYMSMKEINWHTVLINEGEQITDKPLTQVIENLFALSASEQGKA